MPYQSEKYSINNMPNTIPQPQNHSYNFRVLQHLSDLFFVDVCVQTFNLGTNMYCLESYKLLLLYSFLSWPDCSQCDRYGPRTQQIFVHSCFAPPDWMCSSVCGDGAFCLSHWLFAAHGLPVVQRLLPDQGTEGCHWTVSAGCLWVRL